MLNDGEDRFEIDWPKCQAVDDDGKGCAGVQASPFGRCLAHLGEDELAQALDRFGPGRDADVRATLLEGSLFERVIAAFSDDALVPPRFGAARFDHARFGEYAGFRGALFERDASFHAARFSANANFEQCRFISDAGFFGTRFDGDAQFERTHFGGGVNFGFARFASGAKFHRARFDGHAGFAGSQFEREGGFYAATFAEGAVFTRARFRGRAEFAGARFDGHAGFHDARIREGATFRGACFSTEERFGPLVVGQELSIDGAKFDRPIRIEASARVLTCRQTTFAAGASLRLRYAAVVLDAAICPAILTIAASPRVFTVRNVVSGELKPVSESFFADVERLGAAPRLVSLRGVDASRLVLTNVDLSWCRFVEAHHLDQLRIEGDFLFASTPRGFRYGRAWPPVWRWTRRQVLAEERDWREGTRKSAGWDLPGRRPEPTDDTDTPLGLEQVAAFYRRLRKAREDARNEPGAADFYYGEMEMRRHATTTPPAERLIVTAYWALSGYGLRATRALVALGIVVVGATIAFKYVGFPGRQPEFVDTLLYCLRATLSLDLQSNAIPGNLTRWGQILRIVLRVAGPACIGLAAIALRGRVKR